jgi:enoyl-CoA hydratase/carnithine racemase
MADILLAAPSAKFGQPEVNLGTITGGGGSQRLARAVGKSRAMELTLTGRVWTAQEAVAWGMASRIAGEGEGAVVREAIALAAEIAGKSQLAVQAQKEAVNSGELRGSLFFVYVLDLAAWGLCAPLVAFEQGLSEGLRTERRLFHMTFATADQKEGALRHPARNLDLLLTLANRHGGFRREEKAKLHQLVKDNCKHIVLAYVFMYLNYIDHARWSQHAQKMNKQWYFS